LLPPIPLLPLPPPSLPFSVVPSTNFLLDGTVPTTKFLLDGAGNLEINQNAINDADPKVIFIGGNRHIKMYIF
jgi:hypothetical protein